ncbi:adenosylcobinamide-GDP ribazoletransferase [Thalassiella azotivora]
MDGPVNGPVDAPAGGATGRPGTRPAPLPRTGRGDGLRMAFGTLTTVPVPPPRHVDRRTAATAMLLAPLAGAVLAVAAGAVTLAGALLPVPPLVVGVAVVAVVAVTSRGLHLDGLADTVDGLGALGPATDRARALEVMRRGDVGPFGVVALVLVLLTQVACVSALVHGPDAVRAATVTTAVVVLGRAVLPLVCAVPWRPARSSGLGAVVAASVPLPAALAVLAVTGAAVEGLGRVGGVQWALPAAALAGWTVAVALTHRVVRRLGGTTGDVLGAAVEAATTVGLVVAVAVAG